MKLILLLFSVSLYYKPVAPGNLRNIYSLGSNFTLFVLLQLMFHNHRTYTFLWVIVFVGQMLIIIHKLQPSVSLVTMQAPSFLYYIIITDTTQYKETTNKN